MTPKEYKELEKLLREETNLKKRRKLFSFFPDEGPYRRELYKKHMEFIRSGKNNRERLFLAGNCIGKSELGAYECVIHATGRYPDWWEGRRFDRPVSIWCAGDTNMTVRDIVQRKLLGDIGSFGTGMIPGEDLIGKPTPKSGVPHAVQDIQVRHVPTGGISDIGLKSYDQRRVAFQGTEKDVIWLDEEPPLDIYTECLMRTTTTNGMVVCTFTPLQGLSEVVLYFLPHLNPESEQSKDEQSQ